MPGRKYYTKDTLTREEINKMGYPVVVEMWKHIKSGRGKRLFNAEFPTENERKRAKYWEQKFYNWYLVKGTPEKIVMKPHTKEFVERLIGFFGRL